MLSLQAFVDVYSLYDSRGKSTQLWIFKDIMQRISATQREKTNVLFKHKIYHGKTSTKVYF
jgi:hypothetical protein